METNNAIRDRNSIQSLGRGLNILELCAKSSHALTLTEVANEARLTKTTAQRFLNTLCDLGYLRRDENKGYVLTARVLSLAHRFLNASSLVTVAKSYLDELSAQLSTTVNLAVLEDVDTLFLYRHEVRKFMKYDLGPGSRLPCYAGSLGKALLAGLDDAELKARLNKIEFFPITPKTIASKQELIKEIMAIRKRGYSVCDQELSLDMYSIGAPVLDNKGQVGAAINISMEFHVKDSQNLKTSIDLLLETGKMISTALGYEGPYPHYTR